MTGIHFKLSLAALLTITALTFTGCHTSDPQAATKNTGASAPPAKSVRLVPATERSLARTVTAPGTLAADEQAALSFKVPGRLSTLSVDLGSSVRKGQLIAQLETKEFQRRLEQAEAGLQQARA